MAARSVLLPAARVHRPGLYALPGVGHALLSMPGLGSCCRLRLCCSGCRWLKPSGGGCSCWPGAACRCLLRGGVTVLGGVVAAWLAAAAGS